MESFAITVVLALFLLFCIGVVVFLIKTALDEKKHMLAYTLDELKKMKQDKKQNFFQALAGLVFVIVGGPFLGFWSGYDLSAVLSVIPGVAAFVILLAWHDYYIFVHASKRLRKVEATTSIEFSNNTSE